MLRPCDQIELQSPPSSGAGARLMPKGHPETTVSQPGRNPVSRSPYHINAHAQDRGQSQETRQWDAMRPGAHQALQEPRYCLEKSKESLGENLKRLNMGVHAPGLKKELSQVWKVNSRTNGAVKESESHKVVSDSLGSLELYSPWNSPGQNTSFSLLQGIFQTEGSNPGLPNPGLPHHRWILYQLSHKGSPRLLEWVAYPFSSGSSQPRNQNRGLLQAGRFFTN